MAQLALDATLRAASALLRNGGGQRVLLRLPGPPPNGDASDELGLSSLVLNDLPLYPAALRKLGSSGLSTPKSLKLLIAGEAVLPLLGTTQFDSAEQLFSSAAGVVLQGVLYTITHCEPVQVAGSACAYCLTLLEPLR